MSVFKKKTDVFTPENKKIRIEKIQKCRTKKIRPRTWEASVSRKVKIDNKSEKKRKIPK